MNSIKDVVREVRKLALAQPDYVYDDVPYRGACTYTHEADDGTGLRGSCIIGRALIAVGVRPEDLVEFDAERGSIAEEVIGAFFPAQDLTDARRVSWLGIVQSAQDDRLKWASAVEWADTAYELRFTAGDVIEEIRVLAAESGGLLYESGPEGGCWYVRDGKPSCIVGQALARLGVPLEFFEKYEGTNAEYGGWPLRSLLEEVTGGRMTAEEYEWISVVQSRQDTGSTWGEAVAMADAIHELPDESE